MRLGLVTLLALGLTLCVAAFPPVSSDPRNVQLNIWNNNPAAAKAMAKSLNRPALMAFVDSQTCAYSKSWDSNILAKPAWASFIAANPMVLIMADRSALSASAWSSYTGPYRSSTGYLDFPTIVLFHPNGSVADQFLARSTLGKDPGFYTRVRTTTSQYPYNSAPIPAAPGTIGFASSAVTVSESASSVTVQVMRQGGSSGTQSFHYETADGTAHAGTAYQSKSGTLSWGDGDAATKTITVPIIDDHLVNLPASRSFTLHLSRSSGTATLGTSTLTVTVTEAPSVTPPTVDDPFEDPFEGGFNPIDTLSAAGTYNGFFCASASQTVQGTFTLTASVLGKLKVKALLNGVSYSMSGEWEEDSESGFLSASMKPRGASAFTVEVDADGVLTGTFNGTSALGRRQSLLALAPFIGYYTAVLPLAAVTPNSDTVDNSPEGTGYVTFTANNRGSVKYSGVLADGTKFSGSSSLTAFGGATLSDLGYDDADAGTAYAGFPIYAKLASRRGTVAGQLWIDGRGTLSPSDNHVYIIGSSWLYPGTSPAKNANGFAASFDDGAFAEIGAAYAKSQDLARVFEGASFQVDCGTASVTAHGRSIALEPGNELDATLRVSASTGIFSGKFLLPSTTDGTSSGTVKFAGVLVPLLEQGGGYYLEPATVEEGYRLQRSRAVLLAP